jgi:hypothetical protein
MLQIQPVTLGNVQAYESARFIPQLRAWVDNGTGYDLGEIYDTDPKRGRILIMILGDGCPCWYPFAAVHCVHTYYPHTNTVKIHGEPRCRK